MPDHTEKAIPVLPRRDARGRRIGRRSGRADNERAKAQAERIAKLLHDSWAEAVGKMLPDLPEERRIALAKRVVAWKDLHPSTRRSLIARAEAVLEELYHLDKAMNEGTPEEGGSTVPTTMGGLDIEIRDKYRATQLRRLSDPDLLKSHDELHALFEKRPEGSATERYVNSHVALLGLFAEREIEHPKPKTGKELDKLTLDLQKAARGDRKTRATLPVRGTDEKLGRVVAAEEVLDVLDQPFRLAPVYLTGGVVGDEKGTAGPVELMIPQAETLPEWLVWALRFRLIRGGPEDIAERWALVGGPSGSPIEDHMLVGHLGFLPADGEISRVEMAEDPVPFIVEKAAGFDKCLRCKKAAPTIDVVWADGRARAWFCKACFPEWKKEIAAELKDDGLPVAIVREVEIKDGVAPEKIPDHYTGMIGYRWKTKATDPYLEYPEKPARQMGVLQVHAIGTGRHLDLRAQLNRDELIGWTLFAGTQSSEDESAEKLTDAREMIKGWTTDDGNRYLKPLRSPAKMGATPKLTHPPDWLQVQGVMDPGEAGATGSMPGVLAMVEGPDKLSASWGCQKPDFHEYFLEVDGSDPHHLAGVLSVRSIEGSARPGDDEDDEGRKPLGDDRAWIASIEESRVPYVLSPRAVKTGWMPPAGQHALPLGIAERIPEKLRYWTKDGAEAGKVRDFLVDLDLVNDDTVQIKDGSFTLQPQKQPQQKTAPGAAEALDADAPAGEDPSSGAVLPVQKSYDLPLAKAWLGPRRPDGGRMMKAVVYAPLERDSHGDWTTDEVILNAQIFHSLKGMRLNLEHNRQRARLPRRDAVVVQTYTCDVTFKIRDLLGTDQAIPEGAWIMGALLYGKTLRKAERGSINGWSFEGLASSEVVR